MKDSEYILTAGCSAILRKGSTLPEILPGQFKAPLVLKAIPSSYKVVISKPFKYGDSEVVGVSSKRVADHEVTEKPEANGKNKPNYLLFTCHSEEQQNNAAETRAVLSKAIRPDKPDERVVPVVFKLMVNSDNFRAVQEYLVIYEDVGKGEKWQPVGSFDDLADTHKLVVDTRITEHEELLRATRCQLGIGRVTRLNADHYDWNCAPDYKFDYTKFSMNGTGLTKEAISKAQLA